VLVSLSNVTVTAVNPPHEFTVDNVLHINDFMFRATPAVGAGFTTLTGIVDFRLGDSKLDPRNAADLAAALAVSSFGPAGFARVGRTGAPTFPSALAVGLSQPAAIDTFVTISSSDTNSLVATGGGITVPMGQMSAVANLDALAVSADVTLTAQL